MVTGAPTTLFPVEDWPASAGLYDDVAPIALILDHDRGTVRSFATHHYLSRGKFVDHYKFIDLVGDRLVEAQWIGFEWSS